MRILGIDYGRSKIGLAVSEETLATPWKVIRVKNFDDAVQKAKNAISEFSAEKVVVGISEGIMGEESKKFAAELTVHCSLFTVNRSPFTVHLYDETLTSLDAQVKSREAGISQKRRKEMEDAYAAAIMLQNFLDSN